MSDTVFNAEPVSSDTDLSSVTVHNSLVVDQSDMYTHIFSKFTQSNDIPY